MKCTQENWRDIQKYYQGTFVKFKEFGEVLHFINRVDPAGIVGTDADKEEFIVHLHDDQPYSFEYILPYKAVFQHGGDAYLLQRIPARQYKRGLCQENTSITKVASGERQSVNWALLGSFTTKQRYLTLNEAIFGKGKQRTVALNRRMSYSKTYNYLYVDCKVIAIVDPDKKAIACNKLFLDELRELIAQDPFNITIK